jgi:hypothetical protein
LARFRRGDCGFEVVGDGREFGRVGRRRGLWGELLSEFGVLLAQGVEAGLEGGHAFLESRSVEVPGFEGGVVTDESAFGAPGFVGERATLVLERRPRLLRLRAGRIERLPDEGAVAVEGGELVDDGSFEFVAGDAFAVAAFAPEFLAA